MIKIANNYSKICLLGPMGAGKSTIGRGLAEELNLAFFDTDKEIEKKSGANIPWIFDVEGEQGFRRRETAVLAELLQQSSDMVIATGGGIVERADNRRLLESNPCTIYLQASVDQQVERTSKDKNRPLLQTENPRAVLERLLNRREPHYLAAANLVVDTEGSNPKQAIKTIVQFLQHAD